MATSKLAEAMKFVQDGPKTDIKGKAYTQVATRVEAFRHAFGVEMSITTDMLDTYDPDLFRVKASISDATGRVIATGLAQEHRTASKINQTSALEVAETSAIGRALAALGLMGGEYASMNEVDGAINSNEWTPSSPKAVAKMDNDPWKEETPSQFRNEVAKQFPPSENQYIFVVPQNIGLADVNTVFAEIDRIDNLDELTAYYNALQEWLQWVKPEDGAEVKNTFKYRNKQLRG